MSKKILSAIVLVGALMGASAASAAGAASACASSPATAGGAVSAELSAISGLAGDQRRAALDAFVLGLANTKFTSAASAACASGAISQAAQLYTAAEDQQRVQQIAQSIGQNDIQTAALDDTAGPAGAGPSRGSDN